MQALSPCEGLVEMFSNFDFKKAYQCTVNSFVAYRKEPLVYGQPGES